MLCKTCDGQADFAGHILRNLKSACDDDFDINSEIIMQINNNVFHWFGDDILELKSGGGCLSLFGLPFFLAGVFLLLATIQIVPFSNANEMPWWSWLILGFMGIAFSAVGAALVFGRSWISLNRRTGSVTIARGLMLPIWTTTYSMGDYQSLELRLQTGDSASADSYTLWLIGGDKELKLYSNIDYGSAITEGTKLSEFCSLSLVDKTSDHPQILSSSHEAVSESSEQTGIRKPLRPMFLTCLVEENTDELVISAPAKSNLIGVLIQLGFALAIILFVLRPLSGFFVHSSTPSAIGNVFLGFILVFFVAIPLFNALWKLVSTQKYSFVTSVNSNRLKLQYPQQRNREVIINSEEIINLDYSTKESQLDAVASQTAGFSYKAMNWISKLVKARGIILKSRKGIFYLFAGLSDEETLYLYRLISYYLYGSEK